MKIDKAKISERRRQAQLVKNFNERYGKGTQVKINTGGARIAATTKDYAALNDGRAFIWLITDGECR